MRFTLKFIPFVVAATPLAGQVQDHGPSPLAVSAPRPREQSRSHSGAGPDTLPRLHLLAGAHWTTSTGPAAHLALMLGDAPRRHGEYGGPVLSVEPGLHGGKVGIGVGGVSPFGSGLLRASYLRSWGDDGPLAADQGYLGADARMAIRFLALGIGWHGRISGEASGDGSIFTFSAGVGF
jgi:hypothetical protein